MMNYTVTVNPTKRSVTVEYEGYKGTARCCPTDTFDLTVGTELALERAKNKKKAAESKTPDGSVMELAKALEKALPKGQMVVVGNGEMTAEQKKWLRSLAGGCDCKCHEVDEDEIYDRGYDEGYADGYADAEADYEDMTNNEEALNRIRSVLADVGII